MKKWHVIIAVIVLVLVQLVETDILDIYKLCCANDLYYAYCPPFVTEEHIKEDMAASPPNITMEDKYYVGFYEGNKIISQVCSYLKLENYKSVQLAWERVIRNQNILGLRINL